MKVAIDIREAQDKKRAGKGQWTFGFASELASRDISVEYLGYESDSSGPFSPITSFPHGLKWHLQAAKYLKSSKPDLYVSPTSFIVPSLLKKSIPVIPIVHDLIAFRNEPHDRKAKFLERIFLSKALKHSAHICTVSNSAKDDLIGKFSFLSKEDISPIFAGPMEQSPRKSEGGGNTILCIGTLCPRKNQYRLIKAYEELPDEIRHKYQLVLVGGRGWQDQEIVSLAESTQGVHWKGYLSNDDYSHELSKCDVLALPSLYEGFGIPVLDAMQRGIPVLTSDRRSLREVASDAAIFVDPESVYSIAEGLNKHLTSPGLRDELSNNGLIQSKKFNWKRTADLFLEAATKVL